ncbi:tRNA (cmo5U34)-methyltransferase [Methanohalophilus levihalophilus]|uniref:class I SAM-dependent methyltransferase n=1 Tax=Methanohalophilus levihalophilus TaxID=1431282 RepID=UPI001AE71B27|nr:class I SAM-dependent methyltransferase [Methanohalophilus levihalophilus]MBP2029296.1 tRNA (cmo5U34)-methyltransferase [Methanohalophilus levihalophilus]
MEKNDNSTPYNAAEYDMNVRKTLPFYETFHSEVIDFVKNVNPDVKVWLDTGCGSGSLVSKAHSEFPETLFVLADPSESMLEQARSKLKDIPNGNLHFLSPAPTQDIRFDLPDNPDVITAILSHHYFSPEERKKATKRCFDLLPPGGIYITFEHIHPSSKAAIDLTINRWKSYQLSQGRDEETVDEHLGRFDNAFFPISIEEHLELLGSSGFSTTGLLWFSHMQAGFYGIK